MEYQETASAGRRLEVRSLWKDTACPGAGVSGKLRFTSSKKFQEIQVLSRRTERRRCCIGLITRGAQKFQVTMDNLSWRILGGNWSEGTSHAENCLYHLLKKGIISIYTSGNMSENDSYLEISLLFSLRLTELWG